MSTFELTCNVKECAEVSEGLEPNAYGAEALETIARVLRAYGMEVGIDYSSSGKRAKIKIDHPSESEARRTRTRNAGRPRKSAQATHDLSWYESHTPEEGAAEMGVSLRTYYRRIASMREN